jgi:hypothetical protein
MCSNGLLYTTCDHWHAESISSDILTRSIIPAISLLALCTNRTARVLVMTDAKLRKRFRFALDNRVQASAIVGTVLLMLIILGMLLVRQCFGTVYAYKCCCCSNNSYMYSNLAAVLSGLRQY